MRLYVASGRTRPTTRTAATSPTSPLTMWSCTAGVAVVESTADPSAHNVIKLRQRCTQKTACEQGAFTCRWLSFSTAHQIVGLRYAHVAPRVPSTLSTSRCALHFCLTQSASYCRTVGTLRNRYNNIRNLWLPRWHHLYHCTHNPNLTQVAPTSGTTAHAHGRRRDTCCCHTNRTWQTSPPRVCLMVSWNRSCGGKPQKPRTPFAWRQHAQDRKLSRGCHVIADFPVQQAQS